VLDDADLEEEEGFVRREMEWSRRRYLSKCPLSYASEEDEVEKIDIGIKVNDL
jgi:hypothetical protein